MAELMSGRLKGWIKVRRRLVRLFAQRAYRRVQERIEQVEGLLVPGQEFWLFCTAWELPDACRIVEIGSYMGRSTVSLAFACVGTRKHVFAIDRWKGVYEDVRRDAGLRATFEEGFFEIWMGNISTNNLDEYVTPLVGESREIATIWRSPIDFLFVDGSHEYEDVIADFDGFFGYVVPGGIVAFHDVTPSWQGCWRAWHEYIAPRLTETGTFSTIGFGRKGR